MGWAKLPSVFAKDKAQLFEMDSYSNQCQKGIGNIHKDVWRTFGG